MQLRLIATEGYTAAEALQKGFADLMDLCDVVTEKFVDARASFAANGPKPKEPQGEEVDLDDVDV